MEIDLQPKQCLVQTWRLRLNERYVKDYGNTQFQIGTLTQGGPTLPVDERKRALVHHSRPRQG